MDWGKLSVSIFQLIFMAFFTTSLNEVVKDLYAWFVREKNALLNRFRVTKVTLRESDEWISGEAMKFIGFILGIYMCYVLDYGALSDIIQLGVRARGNQAMWLDYIATGSLIRLGASGVFNAIETLATQLEAAKITASKLVAAPAEVKES